MITQPTSSSLAYLRKRDGKPRAKQLEFDLNGSVPARIGFFKLKDRRYHTRRYPEFDRTTSELYRAAYDREASMPLGEGGEKRG